MVKALTFKLSCQLLELEMWWKGLPTAFWQGLAHKLPRRLVMFVVIRVWANASFTVTGKHCGAITAEEMLDAWEKNYQEGM